MKNELILVQPHCEDKQKTKRLEQVLEKALTNISYQRIIKEEDFQNLQNKKILFAISQGVSGINLEYFRFLKSIRMNTNLLESSVAGIIVDGESELFTKSIAREFVFTANRSGCTFPGKPLVEATASLQNFNVQAKILETDYIGAYEKSARVLVEQVLSFTPIRKKQAKILVLHASNFKTSNTSQLWNMVKQHLINCEIKEISLRNGSVQDCSGCPYTMCMHFSSKSNCYYGGVIVDEVYPAILDCYSRVLRVPNYNDSVRSNLFAFINRLTALFRKTRFYEKYIFGIIVSGYSGGDLVAEQLISALNMNKTFILPSRFALLETANDPNSIQKIDGINKRAKDFANHILKTIQIKEN